MSDRHLSRLYGLVVETDFDLHQSRPVPVGTEPDVVVLDGGAIDVPAGIADGEPILDHWWDGERTYSAARTPEGCVLRFHGACEFRISPELTQVVLHRHAAADPGIGTILTTGGLLAFQLFLRGLPVLHASAVDVGGGAIAFVGNSGQGKSTMATLLCADGARLITDDVLRVDMDGDGAVARLGATELRLRKGADELATLFAADAGPGRRRSADDRHVLRLADDAQDRVPLRAIVVPSPRHDLADIALHPVPAREAPFLLLRCLRLAGWQDERVATEHFAAMAAVARRVPVVVAEVPWGPPFDPRVAQRLRTAVVA
ncbi:hypothetical protein [Propionicicella superfundia]|uniref:hypothetical protein n=1 Tax=Propionicicella superfundia TaxID=348582 RepID=UPI000406537E|nr:hypothetical protein [Propionicicella superfundia]